MIVTERRRLSEQQLTVRVTLWGSLMVVHTLFLLLAFFWSANIEIWPGPMLGAFALFAFVGLMAPLLSAVSSLAHQVDHASDGTPATSPRWMRLRPLLWAMLEMISLAMLSFCAAIVVYIAANTG